MARGRKKRTNIKKQVVRNPATPAQTIRRRVLLTGGSGVDSTTTAGGLARAFGGDGATAPAGASATATVVCSFGLLSTRKPSPLAKRSFELWSAHTSTQGICENYTIPRDTGIEISVK